MKLDFNRAKVFLARNAILVALVALIVTFSILSPRFLTLKNFSAILTQTAELGLIALAVGFLLMMGSVDLSVGSVASCAAVVGGIVMVGTGSWIVGILVGLAFGAGTGALNGVLVAYGKLNALVVSIGFLSAWSGLAYLLTSGRTVTGLPSDFTAFSKIKFFDFLPVQIVILLVAIVLAWWILEKTATGRQILAIGGNEKAAHLMGIRVNATRFWMFVVTGVVAALVGLLLGSKLEGMSPNVGVGMEVAALIVVLLGGVAFEGGVGRVSGIVVGLLLYGVLRNGLIIISVPGYLQTFLIGLTLVGAVAIDGGVQRMVRQVWRRISASHLEDEATARSAARIDQETAGP